MFGNLTPMVKNLLIINVGVFLAGWILQINFPEMLGLRYIHSSEFAPYQLITHIFVHGGGMHLFSNMFALFIFGPLLERFWGPQKFLLFFLITGLGASILYSAIHYYEVKQVEQAAVAYHADPDPERFSAFINEHAEFAFNQLYGFMEDYHDQPDNADYIRLSKEYTQQIFEGQADTPLVGASGAIFGILMAFGLLFPNTELFLLFFPFPIKAKYFVTFYGLYELYTGIARVPGDNVAHFAHLGGMLFAFILIKVWSSQRSNFY